MVSGLEAARLIVATVLRPADAGAGWRAATPEIRARAVALAGEATVDLLLASALRAHELEVPAGLASRAVTAKAAAAWSWVEGAAVLDALERAGLAPIALKGGDLSARAYPVAFASLPDRAYLRHATDLDLLLARPDAATAVMREEGFEPDLQGAAHHVRWRKRGPGLAFSVELHDDLFDRPHGLDISMDAMRARAIAVASPDGGTRRVLSPIDALLHVAGHAVYSDLLRDPVAALRGPIDLAVLLAAAPVVAPALIKTAMESGLAVPVGLALEWSALLGTGLPAPLTSAARELLRGGPRRAWGRRRVLRNARAALEGEPRIGGPATAWRALLAPTLGSAFAMLLEGARRRTSPLHPGGGPGGRGE